MCRKCFVAFVRREVIRSLGECKVRVTSENERGRKARGEREGWMEQLLQSGSLQGYLVCLRRGGAGDGGSRPHILGVKEALN